MPVCSNAPCQKRRHLSRIQPERDHTYALPDAKILKRRLDLLINEIEDHQNKQTNANKREKRLRLSLSSILGELKEQRILTEYMHLKLQVYSRDLYSGSFYHTAREYTGEQKDFALTLHMQSGKAYDYVRSVAVRLPHQRIMAKWMTDGR